MSSAERRENQRLRLPRPILGAVEGRGALILDIGISGVLVEHYGTYPVGQTFSLSFAWNGLDIEYLCETARSTVVRQASDGSPVSHTGARLLEPVGDSDTRLQQMITAFVADVLSAQRRNLQASSDDGGAFLLRLGGAKRVRAHGYVVCRFGNGAWSKTRAESPQQPSDGFTISAHEEDADVELLCQAYAAADPEGRRMIRLLAELSTRGTRAPF